MVITHLPFTSWMMVHLHVVGHVQTWSQQPSIKPSMGCHTNYMMFSQCVLGKIISKTPTIISSPCSSTLGHFFVRALLSDELIESLVVSSYKEKEIKLFMQLNKKKYVVIFFNLLFYDGTLGRIDCKFCFCFFFFFNFPIKIKFDLSQRLRENAFISVNINFNQCDLNYSLLTKYPTPSIIRISIIKNILF